MSLKVLFLIDSLRMGGAERITVALLPHFDRSQITPILCTLHTRRQSPLATQVKNVKLVDLGARRLIDPLAMRRLFRLIRNEEVDIIHAQLQDATIFAAVANRLTGVPVCITRHLIGDDSRNVRRRMRNLFEKLAIRSGVNRIISVSDAARDAYAAIIGLPPDRFETIYNGIEVDHFVPVDDKAGLRRQLDLPTAGPLVTMVGVMRPGKGHNVCIEAARQLPGVHFLLVGDGKPHERAGLETMANGLEDRVHFLGQRMDVPQLLAASDLLVLPSESEALPTVLIEAAAARLPVVASHVGGVPEIVEDGISGILIPPHDPSALADNIRKLLQNPAQIQRMGQDARKIALRKFTLSRQAEELSELYRQLARTTFDKRASEK